MDFYIARQPIFNSDMEVVAYELLYRSGRESSSNFIDGDSATLAVINNTALSLNFATLTDGKRGFINFTYKLICDEIPTLFPPSSIVVEVLEDVKPDVKLLMAIGRLRDKGYSIALDDFVFDSHHKGIIGIADIVKVDFLLSSHEERKKIVSNYSDGRVKFLAEKVETREEFEKAVEMGYTYFQGYFFSKPILVRGKDVKAFSGVFMQLLYEITRSEPDFRAMSKIIETDLSLSYKLLKLANSPVFQARERVRSINQAIVRLGETELRKWVTVVMMQQISDDKPEEVLSQSLIRAKLLESMADIIGKRNNREEAFLVGMFSLIDVIMDRPLDEIIAELPLTDEIKYSLLGSGRIAQMIPDIIINYEKGEWDMFEAGCRRHGIDSMMFFDEYYRALSWTTAITKGDIDSEELSLSEWSGS